MGNQYIKDNNNPFLNERFDNNVLGNLQNQRNYYGSSNQFLSNNGTLNNFGSPITYGGMIRDANMNNSTRNNSSHKRSSSSQTTINPLMTTSSFIPTNMINGSSYNPSNTWCTTFNLVNNNGLGDFQRSFTSKVNEKKEYSLDAIKSQMNYSNFKPKDIYNAHLYRIPEIKDEDSNKTILSHCISHLPEYFAFSQEELRYLNFKKNKINSPFDHLENNVAYQRLNNNNNMFVNNNLGKLNNITRNNLMTSINYNNTSNNNFNQNSNLHQNLNNSIQQNDVVWSIKNQSLPKNNIFNSSDSQMTFGGSNSNLYSSDNSPINQINNSKNVMKGFTNIKNSGMKFVNSNSDLFQMNSLHMNNNQNFNNITNDTNQLNNNYQNYHNVFNSNHSSNNYNKTLNNIEKLLKENQINHNKNLNEFLQNNPISNNINDTPKFNNINESEKFYLITVELHAPIFLNFNFYFKKLINIADLKLYIKIKFNEDKFLKKLNIGTKDFIFMLEDNSILISEEGLLNYDDLFTLNLSGNISRKNLENNIVLKLIFTTESGMNWKILKAINNNF